MVKKKLYCFLQIFIYIAFWGTVLGSLHMKYKPFSDTLCLTAHLSTEKDFNDLEFSQSFLNLYTKVETVKIILHYLQSTPDKMKVRGRT